MPTLETRTIQLYKGPNNERKGQYELKEYEDFEDKVELFVILEVRHGYAKIALFEEAIDSYADGTFGPKPPLKIRHLGWTPIRSKKGEIRIWLILIDFC